MVNSCIPDSIQVNQITKALNTLKEYEKKKDIKVLNESNRIVLQFSQKFVPIKRESLIHIVLPNHHSEHNNVEICLFVKDNNKNDREFDLTIQQFNDLLSKNNIHEKIDIVPLKKLKLEYNDYEAKRRLSNSYEMFLADARIFRLLPNILGKNFIARKKLLTKVNFGSKNLKNEIEKAMKTVHVRLKSHGPVSQCTIGHVDQKNKELVENIKEMIKQISLHIDYGFSNIRSINIKTNDSISVPLYISLDGLQITNLKEDKKMPIKPNLEDEVSTVLDGKVRIGNDGRVAIIYNDRPKVNIVASTLNSNDPKDSKMKKRINKKNSSVKMNKNKMVKSKPNEKNVKRITVKSSLNKKDNDKSITLQNKRKMTNNLKTVKKIKLDDEVMATNKDNKIITKCVEKSEKKLKDKTEIKKNSRKKIKI